MILASPLHLRCDILLVSHGSIYGTLIRQQGRTEDCEQTYLIHRHEIYSTIDGGLLELAVVDVHQFPKVWDQICHFLQRPDYLAPCEEKRRGPGTAKTR